MAPKSNNIWISALWTEHFIIVLDELNVKVENVEILGLNFSCMQVNFNLFIFYDPYVVSDLIVLTKHSN